MEVIYAAVAKIFTRRIALGTSTHRVHGVFEIDDHFEAMRLQTLDGFRS